MERACGGSGGTRSRFGRFCGGGLCGSLRRRKWLAELATLQCEVNRKGKQALVHLWSGEGDFQEYGYFPGIEIDPKPPLVWLVAPGLRFHLATDTLLKYLSAEIQVARIGLSEDWRRGLKVIFRQ